MKRKTAAVAVWMIMMLSAVLFYGFGTASATVISPPTAIQLEGGREDATGDWVGGYWTFTVSVDQADSLVGKVSLPAGTNIGKGGEEGATVKTQKTVEFNIKPEAAYYKRTLKLAPLADRTVAPRVYRGGVNKVLGWHWSDTATSVEPTTVQYYTWAEAGWQKYTVFTVSVYVDGSLAGTTQLNTENGAKDITVKTSKGNVLEKNLGRLEGDYTEPQMPTSIALFSDKYIYGADAVQYISYDRGKTLKWESPDDCYLYIKNSKAFSTYWWGTARWDSSTTISGSPAPFDDEATGHDIIAPQRGWTASDDTFNFGRTPVKPEILQGSDSLVAYLSRMCSDGNIASKWMPGYKWHIEYNGQTPSAVVVDIPWGAYSGNPLVTFYVPSELADTWVYRPPIADCRIEAARWVNGSEIENATTKRCEIELKQYGKVESSAVVSASTSTPNALVMPAQQTVTMKPGETKALTFEVESLGVSSNSSGSVLFDVKRSWDGAMTSTYKLDFKLIAPPPETAPTTTTETATTNTTITSTTTRTPQETSENSTETVPGQTPPPKTPPDSKPDQDSETEDTKDNNETPIAPIAVVASVTAATIAATLVVRKLRKRRVGKSTTPSLLKYLPDSEK